MNKTLKKTLSIIITILMLVTTVPFAFAADVNLVINMSDSYGDGWNGNAIQVGTISGGEFTKIADATFNKGKTATYETVISDESVYAFRWTVGSYPDDCSFRIVIGGETVFETSDCSSYANNYYIYIWCNHSFDDSICSTCGLECGVDFAHTVDSDAKCTTCGLICNHSYTNHYCKACGTAESGYYAGAYGADNVNDAIWSLDSEGTLTISGTGKMAASSMSSADYPWYDYAQSITAVVIESGVTTLSRSAFYEYGKLASVSLPDTLTYIDDYVFIRCNSLKSISIPYGVTGIGWNSFRECAGLETIVLPATVTFIDDNVFVGSSLTTVHYLGTAEQWEALSIPEGNDELKNATRHYCEEKAEIEPTCTDNGIEAGWYCNDCDEYVVGGETIPALDHDIVIDVALAPTCTETGLTEGSHCTRCEDATVAQEVISALDHIDNDGDGKCDNGCGYEYEKPADNCDHLCHKDGILGFLWKINSF